MDWTVVLQNEVVRAEYAALPLDMQARFNRIAQLIETQGLEHVREPHVKHLEDRLWEIRMTGRDGIARAIYVTASGKRQACGGGSHFRQENTENPARGT